MTLWRCVLSRRGLRLAKCNGRIFGALALWHCRAQCKEISPYACTLTVYKLRAQAASIASSYTSHGAWWTWNDVASQQAPRQPHVSLTRTSSGANATKTSVDNKELSTKGTAIGSQLFGA